MPSITEQPYAELLEEVNAPSLTTDDKDVNKCIQWALNLFQLFLTFVEALMGSLGGQLDVIRDRLTSLETGAATPTPKATTSAATTTPSRRRCTKCHAHGHVDPDCHTTDPTAMWKQIAANQKRKKTTRDDHAAAMAHPTSLFTPIPSPLSAPYLTALDPQAFAAFAADAQELCRRRQQSTRDKRRARHSATSKPNVAV